MLEKIAEMKISSYKILKNKKDNIIESLENAGYTIVLDTRTLTDECYIISSVNNESDDVANTVKLGSLNVGDIFSYKHELYIKVDINTENITQFQINAINLLTGSQAHIDLDTKVSKIKNRYKS